MLFWKSWLNKKIFFIRDILNADGNFLTFAFFRRACIHHTRLRLVYNNHCASPFARAVLRTSETLPFVLPQVCYF